MSSAYTAATEYKHAYDPSRTAKLPIAPPPAKVITDATSTNIGVPGCWPAPGAKAPVWASPLYMHKPPVGHYTPASTMISGVTPPASFAHAFNYLSVPSAMLRYLSTPYLQPGDAGNGIASRPTSSMAAFDMGGVNAAAFSNAAEINFSERVGTASSWTSEQSAVSAVLMPAEVYRTTTKDSYPLRTIADTQQQRMRDKITSKHVPDSSFSNTTLRCPTAPLPNANPLHSMRFLTVRSSVRRHLPPAAHHPAGAT